MPEIDVGYAIGLEPKEAVAYMRSMGVAVAGNWREAEAAARKHSFAVAGVTQLSVAGDMHAGLLRAVAKGQTAEQFIAELEPKLKAAGWLGKNARVAAGKVDQATGEISPDGKGLTHSRLRFIYREHMANAYAAAKDAWAVANGATRWQYSAVLDSRTRPGHRAMHGRIFRMDDAGAQAFKPRNGFRCRCSCIYYFDAPGNVPSTPVVQTREVNVPAPGGGQRTAVELVDKTLPSGYFRPDAGFDLPPGADWRRALTSYAIDKAGDLPPLQGALAAYRHLQRPGVLDEMTKAWREFALPMIPRAPGDVIRHQAEVFYMGALFPEVVLALQAQRVELTTPVLSMVDSAVAHTLRTTKAAPLPLDWFMNLPQHLFDGPSVVTLDRGKLVLWFDLPGQAGKLAVSINKSVKVQQSKRRENVIASGGVMDLATAADVLAKAQVLWRK